MSWLLLFYFLVNNCVVNIYIIYLETLLSVNRTLKTFMLELAKELMASYCSLKGSAQSSLDATPSARGTSRNRMTNLASAESVGETVAETQSVEECTAAWTAIQRVLFFFVSILVFTCFIPDTNANPLLWSLLLTTLP